MAVKACVHTVGLSHDSTQVSAVIELRIMTVDVFCDHRWANVGQGSFLQYGIIFSIPLSVKFSWQTNSSIKYWFICRIPFFFFFFLKLILPKVNCTGKRADSRCIVMNVIFSLFFFFLIKSWSWTENVIRNIVMHNNSVTQPSLDILIFLSDLSAQTD